MKKNRIVVLVVHGIGDETNFDPLQAVASNLFTALEKDPKHQPHLQVLQAESQPAGAGYHDWREAPVVLSWKDQTNGQDELWEVKFREAHWADLDETMSLRRWLNLVGWALGMSGVRLYRTSSRGLGAMPGMSLPRCLKSEEILKVRAKLFGTSLLFFLLLVSLDLVHLLLSRFSIRLPSLENARTLLYDYLGDVKLYQDMSKRSEDNPEVVGEKSRVAIRRRMIQTLVRTANEYHEQRIDGYYIVAHSLGTVVAYNALMEPEVTLPNFLTEEEWNRLHPDLTFQADVSAPAYRSPPRPHWLTPADAISRARLFEGFKGFLTLGSPLDKFAALWPAIVPSNDQDLPRVVPWINVADVQDIVGADLDIVEQGGCLRRHNHPWAWEKCLFTAHTRYWKARRERSDRLIDRLIPWLQGQPFQPPADRLAPGTARWLFGITLVLSGLIGLLVSGGLAVFFSLIGSLPVAMLAILLSGIVLVAVCSLARHLIEGKA